MKTSAVDKGRRSVDVMRGNVDAAAARSFSWVEELQNDTGADILEGSVVAVRADGTIELCDIENDPRPIGVVVDQIDDGDTGQVVFGGPVDLILVTTSVTAGQFGNTSTTPGQAQISGAGNALCEFNSSGTSPSAFIFPDRNGRAAATASSLLVEDLSTAETDTALVLHPDGTGNVVWGVGGGTAGDITVADAGGYFTGTDVEAVLQELAAKDIGYDSHGNMGATETFSALIGWHSGTFDADCTFTFSDATSGLVASLVLELAEDGTGGWQPTWPGSVVWPGGVAPTHDDTAGTTTIYLFESRDGGTTWYGFQAGGGTSVTYATPAIVLGTAAAAGAADSVIRSDATIVAFDATVPVTQAFGDAAATGSAAVAARRDHRHGMPASGGIGEILISDSHSTPLVFADLLQNEAGTDLLYADTW